MIMPFLVAYNAISCVLSASIGLFLIMRPHIMIELQRQFYARINWRIEPISLEKELRNTRVMGAVLIALSAIALFYLYGINFLS